MSRILCLSLTLCLMIQTALSALHTKEPLLVTKYETLQGKQMYIGKTPINVFLGVPFSTPPVGAHKFAALDPLEPWEGSRRHHLRPSAHQGPWGQITYTCFNTWKQYKRLRFRESCLYLNVYAPVSARGGGGGGGTPCCLLVWFSGSTFLVGSASTHDGFELAAREKVALTLLQHRLSMRSFLSTGDSQACGNWALLDQVAALRWVQENVAAFGGDPGYVTLFVQSSEAMCISRLMSAKVACLAGSNHNSPWILVNCLRVQSGAEVMHVPEKMRFFHLNSQEDPQEIMWFMSPVVDDDVFSDNPVVLLTQGQVAPVPYPLGVNSLEFSWLLPFPPQSRRRRRRPPGYRRSPAAPLPAWPTAPTAWEPPGTPVRPAANCSDGSSRLARGQSPGGRKGAGAETRRRRVIATEWFHTERPAGGQGKRAAPRQELGLAEAQQPRKRAGGACAARVAEL
nr:LOW QUALITY PROTEIN: carboxylesterase 4A [Equus caballus]